VSATAGGACGSRVGLEMVDVERVDRLLSRISDDLRELTGYQSQGEELLTDRTALAATKYYLITAIEGCVRVAQHLIVAEGWPVPESNPDAVRQLGEQRVLPGDLAAAVARSVGFRNLLVHEYAEIDDHRVLHNLRRIEDLQGFVAAVAVWLGERR
jgi:uncharacterized protein YutE (UPF0331/DUF86 family)